MPPKVRAPRDFELPFLPRFHGAIRRREKTMTCRSTRKGKKGDRFTVPGSNPPIRGVLTCDPFPIPLGDVALNHWKEEGLSHPGEFIAVWNQLHPSGYDPEKIQYAHQFEVDGIPEKPIIAWNSEKGDLVGQDGVVMTDAQESKAREYLDRGLITKVLESKNGAGGLSEFYELKPLPGCKQTRKVWVETRIRDPTIIDSQVVEFGCDCQKSRGTSRTPPGPCSHELAVRWFRQKEVKA